MKEVYLFLWLFGILFVPAMFELLICGFPFMKRIGFLDPNDPDIPPDGLLWGFLMVLGTGICVPIIDHIYRIGICWPLFYLIAAHAIGWWMLWRERKIVIRWRNEDVEALRKEMKNWMKRQECLDDVIQKTEIKGLGNYWRLRWLEAEEKGKDANKTRHYVKLCGSTTAFCLCVLLVQYLMITGIVYIFL